MRQLLMVLLVTLVSGHAFAGDRDFNVACPCTVDFVSDTLATVSFQLSRAYDNQTIDSFEINLVSSDEAFGTENAVTMGIAVVTDLPAAGETQSYQVSMPLLYTDTTRAFNELRFYPKFLEDYVGPFAYRVLEQAAQPSADTGFVYFEEPLVFMSRPSFEVSEGVVSVRIPRLKNIGAEPKSSIAVVLGQANSEGAFYRLAEVPYTGTFEPGSEAPAQEVSRSILTQVPDDFDLLKLYVVELSEAGDIADYLAVDTLTRLDNNNEALENIFNTSSVRFFTDADSDGFSDYNEAMFSSATISFDALPAWQINAAVLVTEEAKTLTSDARARAEHLVAHTNAIFRLSGVKGDIVLDSYQEVGSTKGAPIASSDPDAQDQLDLVLDFQAPFESVRALHEDNRTDIVIVLGESTEDDEACGVALARATRDQNLFNSSAMARNDKYNYFVVGINCPDSVLAHEFGHIAGLAHSRAQEETGIRPYALGHGISGEFVTIMPYSSAYGGAAEVELFANPDIQSCGRGKACGVDRFLDYQGADAAFTLNQTIPHIAATKNGYAPILSLVGAVVIDLVDGARYQEPGFLATDVEDGNLFASVSVSGSVDHERAGTYRLVYSVEDSDQNRATVERSVRVTLAEDGSGGVDNSDSDSDSDGDGYADAFDVFPSNASEWLDTDGDGLGNNADTDDDNDGYTDQHELDMGSDPLDSSDIPMSGGLSPALLRVISETTIPNQDDD